MPLHHLDLDTPIGTLRLIANNDALVAILWDLPGHSTSSFGATTESPDHPLLTRAATQLTEYFAGVRTSFDLPLAPKGTPFQLDVWNALAKIPFGRTVSYADIARAIGRPSACRAVGAANGANPIPIVVPCHRVIGSSGSLTGFGGGLQNKSFLLKLESADLFSAA